MKEAIPQQPQAQSAPVGGDTTVAQPVTPTPNSQGAVGIGQNQPQQAPSLFSQVVKCKETTKELLNNPLNTTDTSKMSQYYNLVEGEQTKCLNLVNVLSNENAKAERPEKLEKALGRTKDRIAVEQKQILLLKKGEFIGKEVENMGYINLGISLVRDQEEVAWTEYKAFLEEQRTGQSSEGGLLGPIVIVLLVGVIFAVLRRVKGDGTTSK